MCCFWGMWLLRCALGYGRYCMAPLLVVAVVVLVHAPRRMVSCCNMSVSLLRCGWYSITDNTDQQLFFQQQCRFSAKCSALPNGALKRFNSLWCISFDMSDLVPEAAVSVPKLCLCSGGSLHHSVQKAFMLAMLLRVASCTDLSWMPCC